MNKQKKSISKKSLRHSNDEVRVIKDEEANSVAGGGENYKDMSSWKRRGITRPSIIGQHRGLKPLQPEEPGKSENK